MGRKYILLINDNRGSICYRGEGTVEQVKNDIEGLVKGGVKPGDLEVIPVIGSRIKSQSIILGGMLVIGLGLLWYENICKRARKGRGEHPSS